MLLFSGLVQICKCTQCSTVPWNNIKFSAKKHGNSFCRIRYICCMHNLMTLRCVDAIVNEGGWAELPLWRMKKASRNLKAWQISPLQNILPPCIFLHLNLYFEECNEFINDRMLNPTNPSENISKLIYFFSSTPPLFFFTQILLIKSEMLMPKEESKQKYCVSLKFC